MMNEQECEAMIPRIKQMETLDNYFLHVLFDDGKSVIYDVKEDFTLPGYRALETVRGLFRQAQLDASRTCVFWNDEIDIPSDTIYEYGKPCQNGDLNANRSGRKDDFICRTHLI